MKISDCDIIYDLLPSYIDGICTGATRSCVEAHLADCAACAERARRLRETHLSGESLDRIALETARKIKRRTVRRTAIQLMLALPFLLFGWLAFDLCIFGRGQIGGVLIYRNGLFLLLAACLLASALFSRAGAPRLQRADCGALAASLLTMAASAALMVYGYAALLRRGELSGGIQTPFGLLRPAAAGPVFLRLYGLLTLIQIALCLWAAIRFFRRGLPAIPLLQTALTGAALPLAYLLTLRSMALDFAAVSEIMVRELRTTGVLLALGLAGVVLGLSVSKWRERKNKDLPF